MDPDKGLLGHVVGVTVPDHAAHESVDPVTIVPHQPLIGSSLSGLEAVDEVRHRSSCSTWCPSSYCATIARVRRVLEYLAARPVAVFAPALIAGVVIAERHALPGPWVIVAFVVSALALALRRAMPLALLAFGVAA